MCFRKSSVVGIVVVVFACSIAIDWGETGVCTPTLQVNYTIIGANTSSSGSISDFIFALFSTASVFFVVFQVAHTRFIWIDHGMRLTAWRWDATPPSCLGLCGEVANRRHPQSPTHEQWHHRLKLHTVVCRAVCGVSGRTRIERFDPNGTFNSFFAADLLTDETKHSGMSGLRSRTFRW